MDPKIITDLEPLLLEMEIEMPLLQKKKTQRKQGIYSSLINMTEESNYPVKRDISSSAWRSE